MVKITKEAIEKYLSQNAVPFLPTQKRLCVPIINRIYQKLINGIRFDDITVFEHWVLDGHHRYFSSLLAGKSIDSVPGQKTSATISYEWSTIAFDENDWDTPSKIKHLNELDAAFNNITLDEIEEMAR